MKAARYHRAGHGYVLKCDDEAPAPLARENEVRVRVAYCGICGSDLARYRQISDPPAGLQDLFGNVSFIQGHEFSGVIDQIGPQVDERWQDGSLVMGTRVAVHPLTGCGECAACRMREWNRCQSPEKSQVIGVHRDGAFAGWVTVPADHVARLGERVSLPAAALTEPLAVAVHAVNLAQISSAAAPVWIIGDGPIGLLIAQVLKRRGHQAVRLAGRHAGRLELARTMGADRVEDIRAIRPRADGGVEWVFQVAGSPAAAGTALDLLAGSGQMICLGYFDATSAGLHPAAFNSLIRHEKRLRGSFGSSYAEFAGALRGLNSGEYDVAPLIGAEIPLAGLERGFERLVQEPKPAGKILVRPEG